MNRFQRILERDLSPFASDLLANLPDTESAYDLLIFVSIVKMKGDNICSSFTLLVIRVAYLYKSRIKRIFECEPMFDHAKSCYINR